MEFELSVVLPCYNEAGNLPTLFQRYDDLIKEKKIEIVLVNNGSTDESSQVFETELKKVKNVNQFKLLTIKKNEGYGDGILKGLRLATGRILSYSHADLQCDPKNVIDAFELFLQKEKEYLGLEKKFIVKGKRFDRRENEKLMSFTLDRLASFLLRSPLSDINGQPKVFNREFYETYLKEAPLDLTFDVHFMAKVAKNQIQMSTIPVLFKERTAGKSSWNTNLWSRFKMVVRFLRTVLKASFTN